MLHIDDVQRLMTPFTSDHLLLVRLTLGKSTSGCQPCQLLLLKLSLGTFAARSNIPIGKKKRKEKKKDHKIQLNNIQELTS